MVVFQPSETRGRVDAGATILEASRKLGAGIESVCGGEGTCGRCLVRIEEGRFEEYSISSSMASVRSNGKDESIILNKTQFRRGYRLACQTSVCGDVVIFIPEKSRKGKQVIRKKISARKFRLKPAVRKYTAKLKPATLRNPLGDYERLQAELARRYKLRNLIIDYPALQKLQDTVRRGNGEISVSVWQGKEIIDVTPEQTDKAYGLAVDIGTTTVAGYLGDLTTGEILATGAMMNPQVACGEDIMSRISYATKNKDGLKQMNREIIKGLNQVAGETARRAGIKRTEIIDMTVVGNTCMHHLFLNMDPQYLGRTPFSPAVHHSLDIRARDLGLRLAPGAYVHVLPVEAGFVGADNVGVLIAEQPYKRDEMSLVIDIGTNGELILGNRQRLLSASCATGPAFEGAAIKYGMRAAPGAIERVEIDTETKEVRFRVIGKERWNTGVKNIGARGICGSGIIDIIARMFLAGIIDKSGRFNTRVKSPRLRRNGGQTEFVIAYAEETVINQDIVVCQQDIRAVQLAKGAMYAGAKILMNRLGIARIDKVILAGAFGSYIDKEAAAVIGLFPDCAPENVSTVGNAAGRGACLALFDTSKRREVDIRARKVEYVELTVAADFNNAFTRALHFPHAEDDFPHLKHLLPGL